MKPAYLLSGDDVAKLSAAVARLRGRAEREGGPGALEVFEAVGGAAPDADALIGSIPALSLTAERRYLLADGVERWKAKQVEAVAAALAAAPPDVTVVLVARGAVPKGLAEAVKAAGGEAHPYAAPKKRELPTWLVAGARERGFALAPQAARALISRLGESTVRLGSELDRLALWAGPRRKRRGRGRRGDDLRHLRARRLGARGRDRRPRPGGGGRHGRRPARAGRGGHARWSTGWRRDCATPTGPPWRWPRARRPRQVEADLPMAPYPAKMLVRSVRGVDPGELSDAICAIADLEWWTRGGSDYSDEVAMTLAVRRAAGGDPGA